MIRIQNGLIVTGDGKTVIRGGSVDILNETIVEVGSDTRVLPGDEVIDASDCIVMPGVINHHVHGVTLGPLFPSAAKPLNRSKVREHHKKHLLQGTTTVQNVDGFATMHEVEEARSMTPLRIQTATSHTPLNFKAAQAVDGEGLKPEHFEMTVKRMLELGASSIGEIGGGHTLGGGGQDYLYIPQAIRDRTGVELQPIQARKLKEAVLSRYIDLDAYDANIVEAVMCEVGIDGRMSVEELKTLICDCVLPSIQIGLDAFTEAAQVAARYNQPSIYHNSAPSMKRMLDITRKYPRIIAGHSNHPSFEVDESLKLAKQLKAEGAIIDIATIDCFFAKRLCDTTESFTAFYGAGLVDIISTDYAAGMWDSVLCALDLVVNQGKASLEYAVATATGNVAAAIPNIAPNLGILACGKTADIILVNQNDMSKVRQVIIGGKTVVKDGKLIV